MHQKAYVCLKVGNKYSAEYVNKLYSMVRRWDRSPDCNFFCYTEDVTGINQNISIIPITNVDVYDKWWFKMPLLVEPALENYRKKIFFDLDIVIHGNLDFLDDVTSKQLTVCKSYWKHEDLLLDKKELNTLYNSSVMIWQDASYVYDIFESQEDKYMLKYKGIDRFLQHEDIQVNVLPPGIVYSYKKGADLNDNKPFTFRKDYKIALFHQYPKQQDLKDHDIIKEFWT